MHRKGMLLYLLFLIVWWGDLAGDAPARAGESALPTFHVLIVHSYDPGYVWTRAITQGVAEALKDLRPQIETVYLDAKRRPEKTGLEKRAGELAERIRELAPHVVIAADDVVQEYLVVPYLKDKPGPQIVFCGVNAPPSKYGYPAANVSGVRERWHFREGFALIKRILPRATSAAFLVGDSESGHYVAEELQADIARNGPYALDVSHVDVVRTEAEWQEKIRQYQDEVDVLAIGLYQSLQRGADGAVVPAATIMQWTHAVNQKPTLGFADTAAQNGLLCGVLESGHEQGYLAGHMAYEIMTRRVPAGSLPIVTNKTGLVLVNLATAERLGVDIPFEIIEAAGVVLQ